MLLELLAAAACLCGSASTDQDDVIASILAAFDDAWVVAIGEKHGHAELHELVRGVMRDPQTPAAFDDVAVEWGNALYQDVVDRYVSGAPVPWDSVTMAWRNSVVSPNTVWDSPVYERFFRGVRQLNLARPVEERVRVVLADSPIDWAAITTRDDIASFYDRASAMAESIRRESLARSRKVLFLAGGLHISRIPKVRPNAVGLPIGEATPVALLELSHPGSTFLIQSKARASELDRPELIGDGPPRLVRLRYRPDLAEIPASSTTTLRNRDGSRPDVYPGAVLGDLVDAVLLWDPDDVSILEPEPATYRIDWYWEELNRRSLLLRGTPMDSALRSGASAPSAQAASPSAGLGSAG